MSEQRPHVKARAVCLLGDLKGAGPHPDYKQALQLHTRALQAAYALIADKHPAIRVAAKEVFWTRISAPCTTLPGGRGATKRLPPRNGSARPRKSPAT